ncbi:hypothetical protein H696_00467 [Fonticula alba]|uniref:Pre-mRNA-splicing factor ISY1 n=1 Tax=Fonticula alba TaxID=691883 RepID=A0A058ZHE0_FONAL|nr:hypothetical protein H696_00467 [Fonticula alba]KCV72897.1 hypothetical protein H696_00467 [Fonticula alba]|eukprot:XP_009492598.1 hypothetical protein H696_00467 [Fonticula alba]
MARNEEKAQSMLSRWKQVQQREQGVYVDPFKQRRPRVVDTIDNISEAEKWRGDVTREISRKVAQIQNPGLGEETIRELNDEINHLFRERRAWEHRIKALGGADYTRMPTRILDKDGKEAVGSYGYKYFGAAKDLPGVREHLEAISLEQQERRKKKESPYKGIDADYYGYRDEDDGILLVLEAKQELHAVAEARAAWLAQQQQQQQKPTQADDGENPLDSILGLDEAQAEEVLAASANDGRPITDGENTVLDSHLSIPSQEEMKAIILGIQKRKLVELYATRS